MLHGETAGGSPPPTGPGSPATVVAPDRLHELPAFMVACLTGPAALHLWRAIQIVIDLATTSCVRLGLGSPATSGDAFRALAADVIPTDLGDRLARAAGFRDLIVHAYADLDVSRVHAIARHGPPDLQAFLAALRDRT